MTMKKISIITILTICIVPAFADNEPDVDIAANASDVSCDSGVLQTSSGSSTLEADWSANHVRIKWYDGDNEIELTQADSAAAECVYDGTLTLPTAPSKNGYTFAGWKVKAAPQCSLSNLDPEVYTTQDANHIRWKNFDGVSGGATMESIYGTENSSDLQGGEWSVTFDYGTVKGVSTCAEDLGTTLDGDALEPNQYGDGESTGVGKSVCYCKATKFTPIENNVAGQTCSVSLSSWVKYMGLFYENYCAWRCTEFCARVTSNNSAAAPGLRQKLFGISE